MAKRERSPVTRERAKAFFDGERTLFCGLTKQALTISNRIGRQFTDERRGMATWLFMRACVTAKSIEQLFHPPPTNFGDIKYLDHGSIAALSRAMIENVTVLLYIGDAAITEDEWKCRKYVIDIHDFVTRSQFLTLIGQPPEPKEYDETLRMLRDRALNNPVFNALPAPRQKRLLDGDDMFVDGRQRAMNKIGWSENRAKGVYKYLSNQAHSMPMAFHRTELNRVYERDSAAAMSSAGFSLEAARKALGAACLRMVALFPETELAFDRFVIDAMRTTYGSNDPGLTRPLSR